MNQIKSDKFETKIKPNQTKSNLIRSILCMSVSKGECPDLQIPTHAEVQNSKYLANFQLVNYFKLIYFTNSKEGGEWC